MPSITQKDPKQEAHKTLTIRVSPGLHARLKVVAKLNGISINEYVKRVLLGASTHDAAG